MAGQRLLILDMRIRNVEDAKAAFVTYWGDRVPEGVQVAVSCIVHLSSDGDLWGAWLVIDAVDDPFTGARTILGPDGRFWKFSSNPAIHDPDITLMGLVHLYEEGVADLVDADQLTQQVKVVTRMKDSAVWGLADMARRGELRRTVDPSN